MAYELLALMAVGLGAEINPNLQTNVYDTLNEEGLHSSKQLDGFNVTRDLFKINNGQYSFLNLDDLKEVQPASVNVKEIVELLKSVYGLNVVQIANMVGVSRPSVYNHISGKEVPQSFDRYQYFYDLAKRVQLEVKGVSLKQGMKSVLVNGSTLLHRLKDKNINEAEFVAAAKIVAEKLSNRTVITQSHKDQIANAREYIKAG